MRQRDRGEVDKNAKKEKQDKFVTEMCMTAAGLSCICFYSLVA